MFFTAVMKLHPVHRRLTRLEIDNIREYFLAYGPSKAWQFFSKLKPVVWLYAAGYCYVSAIKRIVRLSKEARQDYFALNRHGCFSCDALPEAPPESPSMLWQTPLLIIPGLNTPPMFFRQMTRFFTSMGYPVSVLKLPEKGLADVETSSLALSEEIDRLKATYQSDSVNVIGHCLGGLIAQHYLGKRLSKGEKSPIKHLITLGTGFMGAQGVQILKDIWAANHPSAVIPKVFDELIGWNVNLAHHAGEVVYHNFITIWDFMVHFKNALLNDHSDQVKNYIIDDSDIDHLTIVLNPKMFQKIALAIAS